MICAIYLLCMGYYESKLKIILVSAKIRKCSNSTRILKLFGLCFEVGKIFNFYSTSFNFAHDLKTHTVSFTVNRRVHWSRK